LPVSALDGRPADAEPLPGNCMTILEPRVAHVTIFNSGVLRQLIRNPTRVRAGLLNPQPIVFSIAAEIDVELFRDDEIAGC